MEVGIQCNKLHLYHSNVLAGDENISLKQNFLVRDLEFTIFLEFVAEKIPQNIECLIANFNDFV